MIRSDTTNLSNFRSAFTCPHSLSRIPVDQATEFCEGGEKIVLPTFDEGCWSAGDIFFTDRFHGFRNVMKNLSKFEHLISVAVRTHEFRASTRWHPAFS